ncbi:helix-turn-helix domain-containing protein [Dactylosporangium sp. NPDC049140]|uniref:ArsR/SmtB family transcription factor n=1 Tax=Dactylosporangium sp. NPDC049140 TaxID=3155647 RepID=UPI0033F3A6AD
MPDAAGSELATLATAKALANPVRQRILRELEILGEATSTLLAPRLGVTTGGASYNLRVLAEHGFVEEIPERARGKERWWRLTRKHVHFPRQSEQSPQLQAAIEELNQLWLAEDLATFARFQGKRPQMGPWSDALPYSRGSIRVSLAELSSFFEEYLELLKRYQRPADDTPAGARTVLTRFVAFPDPEEDHDTD